MSATRATPETVEALAPARAPGWRARSRRLRAAVRERLHGRDLVLASAGATLYGALAVVPSLLVAVALAQVVLGRAAVADWGARLADTLPGAMGAPDAAARLLDAGLTLTPVGVLFAVVMGSAYGEGLSRALRRFAPVPLEVKRRGIALRAATLPLLGLAPLMLSGMLALAPWLADIVRHQGAVGVALASYVSLNAIWIATWAPLTWTFHVVGPGNPSWLSAFAGAVVTGAFVSGFLQGFLVFLALPVDLGRPFGGLVGVGVASALLLWLWVLHLVVVLGYAFMWGIEAERTGRTTDPPARPES